MRPRTHRASVAPAVALAAVLASFCAVQAQEAQPSEKRSSRALHHAREAYREKLNENVLFLMGGQLGAAYIAIAHDIAVVVDEGINLRVLPVVGGAGVQNVHDVVFLRGVDLALTNIQTLDLLKASGDLGPNLDKQVSYIAPLFPEELQIVARGDAQVIEDLRGKRVAFNNKGSATAMLAPAVFKALGINVTEHFMSQPDALQKMRAGELDATVCMCPKPVPVYSGLRADSGFRMVEVPFAQALQAKYLPATVVGEDYPGLMPKGSKVETIASSTVLITFNWPRGSARYNRTAKFVDAFFSKFAQLQKPPRHPLWKTVNYAANLEGWQRFPAAQEWLDRAKTQEQSGVEAAFGEFLKQKQASGDLATDEEGRDRLFREFLEIRQKARR